MVSSADARASLKAQRAAALPYEEDVVNNLLIQLDELAKSGIFHYRSL